MGRNKTNNPINEETSLMDLYELKKQAPLSLKRDNNEQVKKEAEAHKNARTSHQRVEKECKNKTSFFGDRGSRQFVRDEMVNDGLSLMEEENDATHSNRM